LKKIKNSSSITKKVLTNLLFNDIIYIEIKKRSGKMKNIKWTSQELLDMFNKETNVEEMQELYKALIAYELGITEINEQALNQVIEKYYNTDTITSMLNENIMFYANELLDIN
jgi:hypothetical protein